MGPNEYLVLLVGTNPLPNYVSVLALRGHIKEVFLICSQDNRNQAGTDKIGGWLKSVLLTRGLPETAFRQVQLENASSAELIERDLEQSCLHDLPENALVNVNYTGGTKAMAVHVHAWFLKKFSNAVFSYLDARSSRIVYDHDRKPPSGDLRDQVNFESIEELLALHGYEYKPTNDASYAGPLQHLVNMVNNGDINTFLEWKSTYLRNIYYVGGKIPKSKAQLLKHLKLNRIQSMIAEANAEISSNADLRSLLEAFPEESRCITDEGMLWIPDENSSSKEIEKRLCKPVGDFLDGRWLEHHVFAVVQELAREKGLKEGQYGLSLEAKKSGCRNFELDIFILRGYELTGISITTAGAGKAKSKSFEVMHRVQQIGGDESKALVIGAMSDEQLKTLEDDISFLMSGATEDHFAAIGTSDWKSENLKKKLRDFIWQ